MIKALAIVALVPIALGPLPQEERVLTASLCNGGTITIPLSDDEDAPQRDCHQQACHAGTCREKSKRSKT